MLTIPHRPDRTRRLSATAARSYREDNVENVEYSDHKSHTPGTAAATTASFSLQRVDMRIFDDRVEVSDANDGSPFSSPELQRHPPRRRGAGPAKHPIMIDIQIADRLFLGRHNPALVSVGDKRRTRAA